VKIAVVDSGINPALSEFAGRIDPASQDISGGTSAVLDREGHGTQVSGVAAAARDNSGVMGVAFDATIISLNTADAATCSSSGGCSHYDTDIARAVDVARENGAKVINISLGGPSIEGVLLQALTRAAEAGIVVVISAGNESEQDPQGFAQQAAVRASSGNVIIAGAVDRSKQLASFSNWAGEYSAFYLSALGVGVFTIGTDGGRDRVDGTSFSAPIISGAAALLASAFPNLSGAQIVEILLKSADDAGAPGVDKQYGHGVLNIPRAFQPMGTTSLAGSSVEISLQDNGEVSSAMGDATGSALKGAIILDGYSRAFAMDLGRTIQRAAKDQPLRRAIGSNVSSRALSAGATSVTVTVLQKMDGQPWVGLAQTGMSPEDGRQVRLLASSALTRLGRKTRVALGISEGSQNLRRRLEGAWSGSFLVAQDASDRAGFVSRPGQSFGLRHDIGRFGLTVTTEQGEVSRFERRPGGDREDYRLSGVSIDRNLGGARVSLGLSHLKEKETVLGGRFSGPLFGTGSVSYFLDGAGTLHLGEKLIGTLRYRRGWTRFGGGELADFGRLVSDAFSLDVTRHGAFSPGDSLAFRITQPLRVTSGGFGVEVPVSYDYGTGAVGFEQRILNLAPTGRELDFEAAYSLRVGGGDLGGNLFLRRQPGHIRSAENDLGGAIRLSWDF
jgi:hypothetical protein